MGDLRPARRKSDEKYEPRWRASNGVRPKKQVAAKKQVVANKHEKYKAGKEKLTCHRQIMCYNKGLVKEIHILQALKSERR